MRTRIITAVAAVWLVATLAIAAPNEQPQAEPSANPLGLPDKALASGGSLIVCGGGTLPKAVYDEFFRRAGGKEAKIIVIPSAAREPDIDQVKRRFADWRRYEPALFDVLHAKSREEADGAAFNEKLAQATGVWFSGGQQSRIAALYVGVKAEATLRGILERGGVIGGTSAGAAAMSRVMIRSGKDENVMIDKGLGLLESVIVDQHFTQRKRLKRLLVAIGRHADQIGVGVDEGTAVVVQGNRIRVLGSNQTSVVLPRPGRDAELEKLSANDQADLLTVTSAGKATIEMKRVARD